MACRRCSNYIFILDLASDFKGFGKDSRKVVRDSFKCWDLVRLILETWRYMSYMFAVLWWQECPLPRLIDTIYAYHGENILHTAHPWQTLGFKLKKTQTLSQPSIDEFWYVYCD